MFGGQTSIRRSATMAMLAVGLLPLTLLALVSATVISRQVRDDQLQRDGVLVRQVSRQVEQVIASAIENLELLATNPRLIGSDVQANERRLELNRIIREDFREISLLDSNGFIVENTGQATEVQDYSPWFKSALSKQIVFVSSPHRRRFMDDLLISFYIPVDPASESETAVIKATLTFDRFGDILSSVELAENDILVLMDGQKNLLYSTDHRESLRRFEVSGIKSGDDFRKQGRCVIDDGGDQFFVAETMVPPNQVDEDQAWVLGYFREPVGVMAMMHHSYRSQAIAAAVGAIFAGLLGWFLAGRLTLPIIKIRNLSRKIAEGDLSASVPVESQNEVGLLAETMNKMVTDLRKSRLDLRESLHREGEAREKEVLLNEIHHRIKNNLQILASVFRMKARRCSSDEMKQFLKDSETRIRAMGGIHQTLYESRNLSEIKLGPYLRSLSKDLLRVYSNDKPPPQVDFDVVDVEMGMDTALPCGLIVNELLSNSLKYAFPDDREGTISVSLKRRDDDGGFVLDVSDDGVGLRTNGGAVSAADNGESLGLRLVDMLADQLDGDAVILSPEEGGVSARINFSESEYTQRLQ